jgi:transcriptional regulator with XRE-family HTH domain
MGSIGTRLRDARTDKGLRQKDLAKKLGVGQTAVSHWENESRELTASQIVKICLTLRITPNRLFSWKDEL